MKESKYQKLVLDYLKSRGAWCFTSHGGSHYQVAGLPDIIGVYKGVFLGFELKTGNYKATELQKSKLNAIQEAGGVGLVLTDDFEVLNETLHYIDTYHKAPKQQPYLVETGIVVDD